MLFFTSGIAAASMYPEGVHLGTKSSASGVLPAFMEPHTDSRHASESRHQTDTQILTHHGR